MDDGETRIRRRVGNRVLLVREFTQVDIVRFTGLHDDAVKKELERLREEGFLELEGDKYRLTGDSEKRLELSRSIEFLLPPPSDKPSSRHYFDAQELINRAEEAEGSERQHILDHAQAHLDSAFYSEGGNSMPDPVKEAIEIERKRIKELRD